MKIQLALLLFLIGQSVFCIAQTGLQSPDYFMDGSEPVFALDVRQGKLEYAACEYIDSIFQLTLNPNNGAPVEGMEIRFISPVNNPGPVKLKLGGFGPYSLTIIGFVELEPRQILRGQVVTAVFDGRSFQMTSPVAPDVFGESEAKKIFVSSEVLPADLGGLEGADEVCQSLAIAAGLNGEYVALLSTSEVHARDRTTHDGLYVNLKGSVVSFNGFQDAWDEQIPAAVFKSVRYNEFGEPIKDEDDMSPVEVWTGSGYDGRFVEFTNCPGKGSSCKDWTWTGTDDECCCEGEACQEDKGACGISGSATSNTGSWIYSQRTGCAGEKHLYCIQR
jgi:hypothetical protein